MMNKKKDFRIDDYREILFTVYRLAKERNNKQNEDGQFTIIKAGDDLNGIIDRRQQSKLLQYLSSLDMDAIKVIQTVMYIGRDYENTPYTDEEMETFIDRQSWDPEYQIPEKLIAVHNPDGVLDDWMNSIKKVDGWKSKEIEINQIYGKASLDEYLERAFTILQIKKKQ